MRHCISKYPGGSLALQINHSLTTSCGVASAYHSYSENVHVFGWREEAREYQT